MDFRLILKEFFAEKTRLLLTILAVAWGTFAIAGMLAIGEGLRVSLESTMSATGKGLLYVFGGQTQKAYQGQASGTQVIFNRYDLASVRALPSVRYVSAEYELTHPIQRGDATYAGIVQGVEPIYGQIRNIIPNPGGRFIDPIDIQQQQRVIVLGNKVVEALFKPEEEPVGKLVKVKGVEFRVIGTLKDKMQMFSVGMPDDYLSWIPVSSYALLANIDKLQGLIVVPKNVKAMPLLKQQIRTVIALNHQLDPTDVDSVDFLDSAELQQRTHTFSLGIQMFLGIVGGLTLVVAGVGIANVMYVSVSKATREIGIRMAVGAKTYQILSYYLIESLLTTAIGGLFGLLASWGLVKLLKVLALGFISGPLSRLQPVLSGSVIAVVLMVLGTVGLLAGLFPARKAAAVEPVEALRYE